MPDGLLSSVLVFARELRAAGAIVREGGVLDAVRALEVVGIRRRDDVRDALRAVLISRQDDLALFDQVFDRFWRARRRATDPAQPVPMHVPVKARSSVRLTAPAPARAADSGDDRID